MVKIQNLSKNFGDNAVLSNVSFEINKGEIVGFLGPNGAGKSTTMNILTGFLSFTEGRVEIDGLDIFDFPDEAKKSIGYLPETPPLYPEMTVTEYLNFVYDKGGIITYPDMIKVKVCKERGVVSGIDADNYYMNHRERSINEPKFTLSDAYDKVSDKLEIRSSTVTVIPTGGGNEVLAYEFIGESNEQTYYVYLDANTLQELDIFKVVNTSEGRLLI